MPASQAQHPAPSSQDVEGLATWMRSHYGLAIGASAKAHLAGALAIAAADRRATPSRCTELAALGDEELRQAFISAVTIHETYFFRHPEQFELLRELAEQQMRKHPRSPVRALSAGCASGEEAYSIAAALDSAAAAMRGPPRIEVLGIDIDRQSLAKARAARYGRWSIRAALPPWAASALVRSADEWTVADRIRARVRFSEINLHDSFLPLLLARDSPFDFIFIRNLLMYLVPKAASRVAEQLTHLAAPSGYLAFSPLDLERVPNTLQAHPKDLTFFARGAATPVGSDGAKVSSTPPDSSPLRYAGPDAGKPRSFARRTAFAGGNAQLGAMLAEAKRLTDCGELTRARAICGELLRDYPRAPAALFLAALVELESERWREAEKLLHRAIEREADFALAHFALAIMLRRQGRVSESRARLLRLSRMLADVPSETILAGPEEISCGWLRSLVSHHLDGHGDPALT
ncbi:MAG TPA: CheR family methyltransferase [Myxococcaceae bacterium]|nr:CheR family methyltransferase [Myxococcaceae bacterium]